METKIAALLLKGWENKEIAKELNMAHSTLRGHFNHMYLKFGIGKRWCKRVKLAMVLSGQ